jgi:hypothetical protein
MTFAASLLTPEAVRERTAEMFEHGLDGRLAHFSVDMAQLQPTADFVARVVRENYPTLEVPFHARWRHFVIAGSDRWSGVFKGSDKAAKARAEFDLAITSVLLDAGAGAAWSYPDRVSGQRIARSEGLALASLDMFVAGAFSSETLDPLRADASRLAALTPEDIAAGFSVDAANPLVGIEGRTGLLSALGRAALQRPDLFSLRDSPRPGGLFDYLAAQAVGGVLPARTILIAVLEGLGPIWPGRSVLDGVNLGDVWPHPALKRGDATNGLVAFHKLSQWLTYSLIEPLERAGVRVVDIDGLTGLAEYRNGGLFVDLGVIALKNPEDAGPAHAPGSILVVEWRALTVALLDQIAPLVRERLGVSASQFPLAKVLEGGTWAAGRRIAAARRAGGGPPLTIASDGTVF